MSRAAAERAVIAAAKQLRAARGIPALNDAHEAIAKSVDELLAIEAAGPTAVEDLDERTIYGIWNMFHGWGEDWSWSGARKLVVERATPAVIFEKGSLAFWRAKNIGARTIEKLESVLRANGLDVDDWRSR